MFNKTSTPVTEPTPDVTSTFVELVPLSHLALDLPAPEAVGWGVFLADRGIAIVVDDVGRLSISRDNARQLLSEHRENEARAREMAAEREAQAIELDRQRRASLPAGVPVSAIPAGMTYGQAIASAELDSQTYRPSRRTLMEDVFDGAPDTLTFHPIGPTPDEES
jgi:hypothetical protein